MTARERLVTSLQALISHLDSGGIQDTALPGTHAAEATRLTKNGLSVVAFTTFEHFIKERVAELLGAISSAKTLPPFHDLPEALQLAATRGVVDALNFRLRQRDESLDTSAIVTLVQSHAKAIVSSHTSSVIFSDWSFGWASSNINQGTLIDFLRACNAGHLYNDIQNLLRDVGFDYSAAGLAENGNLKLSRIAGWRHVAAHNATISIDVELLRTRTAAYLAIAFAFDLLASLAVRVLIDGFSNATQPPQRSSVALRDLRPTGSQFQLSDLSRTAAGTYYSPNHCMDSLTEKETPEIGAVVVRDAQERVIDWFFH
jgi:hypothetical protein